MICWRRKLTELEYATILNLLTQGAKTMANVADTLNTINANVTALQTAVAAIQTGTGGTVDLTPVTTAVAAVQTTVNDIDAKLTPTT